MWVVMILSEKEKEALVIELLNKGLTSREIAKQQHVSFSYIKTVRAKITGDVDEKKNPLSIPSKAFKMFLKGRSIVQVAIGLDLPTDQAMKIHSDYLALQYRQDVISYLFENRNNPTELLKLLRYLRENQLTLKDVKEAVDIKRDIKNYKLERDQLELDNFNSNETLKWYHQEIDKMKKNTMICRIENSFDV
jgi:hypothetical protein